MSHQPRQVHVETVVCITAAHNYDTGKVPGVKCRSHRKGACPPADWKCQLIASHEMGDFEPLGAQSSAAVPRQ